MDTWEKKVPSRSVSQCKVTKMGSTKARRSVWLEHVCEGELVGEVMVVR